MNNIHIGTSGWHYDHWQSIFYPEKLPKSEWLGFYSKKFKTVEINNTFYRLPKDEIFESWHDRTPENFIFSVKASRFITHFKKLKDVAEQLQLFLKKADMLEEKLGPILYQLPPNLHKNIQRLENFLLILPTSMQAVFEFRHDSWYSHDVYELLDKYGFGFCIHDMPNLPSPRTVTSNMIYIRFHGPTGKYEGNYSNASLQKWAGWIKEQKKQARNIYIYFNNDINANAVRNAQNLHEKLLSQ